ncbi:MAG: NAD-dependent epimerase/dehydratase family protein [Acidobacteria bacterium]|nr:NAD-dependent epimerase/dehydratase family protein [Acidobacteriota bacterium]
MDKIKAIITGATGMVGEGVLHECLKNDDVEQVLVVGRRSCEVVHTKLTEIVHRDFFDLSAIEDRLGGYDACFFCLGSSSVGVSEEEYFQMTYELTMSFAKALVTKNPEMTFCYVSGKGTDSTEKGRLNWARVKGKTENDLMKLPFKGVFAFRIGFVKPNKNYKNTVRNYKYLGWLYPVVKAISGNLASTLEEVGLAMINAVKAGDSRKVLEVRDIIELAQIGNAR